MCPAVGHNIMAAAPNAATSAKATYDRLRMTTTPMYRGSRRDAPPKRGVGIQQPPRGSPGILRRLATRVWGVVDRLFGALSTAVLLAVIVTIPILQFFALGYLLNAARRIANTGRLRDGFVGVREASRIGQFVLGCWLFSLPLRLALSLHADARLIAPDAPPVIFTSRVATLLGAIAAAIAVIALTQGGQLVHFFRPLRAARRLVRQLRGGDYAPDAWARFRRFFGAFGAPKIFSLGVRGYFGAALWLLLPTTLIALSQGRGPLLLIGMGMMVVVLVYLPFLQIHFAVHNNFNRIFQVDAVQFLFKRAPIAFFIAFLSTLLLALPLYALKIEIVPRDALWLPSVVFIVTTFPTKLLAAWAYHRGAKREPARHKFWIWTMRLAMLPVALTYTFVVFLSQFLGWHGVVGLYEHHAFLLPVPF